MFDMPMCGVLGEFANTGWLRSQPSSQATPAATFLVLVPDFIISLSPCKILHI